MPVVATIRESLDTIREAIDEHFASEAMQSPIFDLRRSYQETDFAEVVGFTPPWVFDTALGEVEELFNNQAKRRDIVVAQSGHTPRKYSNLDRDALAAGCTVVPELFHSRGLRSYLEQIVGETVLPVPYTPEEYIAARLHEAGDVHGWHWDDYTWALVWIFKIPDETIGGSVDFIARAPWDRENPRVGELVAKGPVVRRHPGVGNAYLLKADTALHRVAPLSEDAERMIVCYTFATESDLTRPVDHSSMEDLYPETHERHFG